MAKENFSVSLSHISKWNLMNFIEFLHWLRHMNFDHHYRKWITSSQQWKLHEIAPLVMIVDDAIPVAAWELQTAAAAWVVWGRKLEDELKHADTNWVERVRTLHKLFVIECKLFCCVLLNVQQTCSLICIRKQDDDGDRSVVDERGWRKKCGKCTCQLTDKEGK